MALSFGSWFTVIVCKASPAAMVTVVLRSAPVSLSSTVRMSTLPSSLCVAFTHVAPGVASYAAGEALTVISSGWLPSPRNEHDTWLRLT